jgi:hypothetical protein
MARGEAILAAMAGISKKGPYAALARSRGTLTVVGSKLKPEGVFARRGLAVQHQNVGIEAGKISKTCCTRPFFWHNRGLRLAKGVVICPNRSSSSGLLSV